MLPSSRVTPIIVTPTVGSNEGLTTATSIDDIVELCCPSSFSLGMKNLLKEIYSNECKRLNILASLESLQKPALNHMLYNGGRRLNTCQWCLLRTWG